MYLPLIVVVVWLALSVPAALLFGAIAGGADRVRGSARSWSRPRPAARGWNLGRNRRIVVPLRTGRAAWSKTT